MTAHSTQRPYFAAGDIRQSVASCHRGASNPPVALAALHLLSPPRDAREPQESPPRRGGRARRGQDGRVGHIEPGWPWSTNLKPIAGRSTCQVSCIPDRRHDSRPPGSAASFTACRRRVPRRRIRGGRKVICTRGWGSRTGRPRPIRGVGCRMRGGRQHPSASDPGATGSRS
jgi:hypothetical protein